MEKQAYRMIERLDPSTLEFLVGWDYMQRGQTSFWGKYSEVDSLLFNCSFYPFADTPKLSVYQVDKFLNYFNSKLSVDTAYYRIQFTKIGDTALDLVGTDNHGQDVLLFRGLSFRKTFPEQNPFDLLAQLTQLKDDLNVIGISHLNSLGGFIQFYLPSGQHILTYLPDPILNSPDLNKYWKADFLKGKKIKPYWNYRKLEGPIDGG